ncbi:hypothetical protein QE422_003794 [Chryseobacterium sp. SORGH_AS 447]|nr:hypothetical protein [Chryseobacterium sp. SORGH_AS_0447]
MFEDGSRSWMFSTSWHRLIITLPIFYIFKQLMLKAVGEFYIKLPASFFQHPTLYFSSFSLISFAIGLSRTLNSSLGFS